MSFVLSYLILGLLNIAVSITAMLAIKFDCEAEGIKSKTGWMIFAFFIPILAGIIYLCCRKSAKKVTPKYCPACGTTNDSDANFCTQCGNIALENYKVVGGEKKKKTALILMIIAICLIVASNVFNYLGVDESSIIDSLDSYSDYFDDFDEYDDDDDYDYDDDDYYDEDYFSEFDAQ